MTRYIIFVDSIKYIGSFANASCATKVTCCLAVIVRLKISIEYRYKEVVVHVLDNAIDSSGQLTVLIKLI